MSDLLVKGGPLWRGGETFIADGAVLLRGGRVAAAGPADEVDAPPGTETLDAAGGLIMPGLVNAHCHGPMTLFRGMADDLPLMTWLNEHMFPAEARWVDPEMTELCSLLAAAEMLLSGTTTVGDSYFCMDGAVAAYVRAGLRAVAAQGLIGFPAPGVPDPADGLETCRQFVERWQTAGPLITPGIFVHSIYTCPAETIKAAARLSAELACPLFTHLAETRQEADDSGERNGATPALWLDEQGILERFTAVVHGAWLTRPEMDLLAEHGVPLVLCPESNMKLASGLADYQALTEAGVSLGLGTDGAASNNDLDLIGEMGTLARAAKLKTGDPAMLPALKVLQIATSGSARALGLAGKAGELRPGRLGDLIVLDLNAPAPDAPLQLRLPSGLCRPAQRRAPRGGGGQGGGARPARAHLRPGRGHGRGAGIGRAGGGAAGLSQNHATSIPGVWGDTKRIDACLATTRRAC